MSEYKNIYDGSSDNFYSSCENGEDIDEIFSASTSKINTKRSEKGQPASSKSQKSNFDILANKRRGSEDTAATAVDFSNVTSEKSKIPSNPIIIRRQIKRPKKGDGKSIKRPLLVNGLNENSTPSIPLQNADNENSLTENHLTDKNLTLKKVIPSSCKESSTNFYNGMKLENNNQGQYLGIQPAIKFRCFKCSENNFLTIAGLQKHMSTCSGVISKTAIRNRRNRDQIPESRTTMCITRRVYLCSSCRTYYQTWDLFVHMREVHKRQICLYCLNMFMNSMELKNHLIAVHKQSIVYYPSAKKLKQDFKDSFFVSCSDCNRLFTEGDNFTNHKCDVSGNAQSAVCSSRPIVVTPKKSTMAAGASIKKAQSNESSVDEDDYDISHAASFCHVDLGGGGADEIIGGSSLSIVDAKKSLTDSTNFPSSTKSSKKLSKLKRDEIDDERVIKKKKISINDNNMPSLKFVIQRKSKDHVYLKNKSDVKNSSPSFLNNDKTTMSFSDDGGEELNEKSIPTYDKLLTTSTPMKNIDEILTNGDIDKDDDDSEGGERRLVIDEDYQQKNDDDGKISDLSDEEKNIGLTNDGIQAMALTLDDKLDTLSLQTIIKECIRTACSVCLYCNNATNIAINGKQLAIHLLENHKFTPTKNNTWTDVIRKLKSGFDELESIFFNTDSFDSSDPACHVPFNQIFACFQCHYVGTLQKELHLHKRKAHMKNIFSCIMCKCNFASYSELFCHLCPGNVANRPACYEFRCCFCGLNRIPSAFRLMVHLRKAHHTCDICMEKTDDQQKLYQHLMKHKIHHLCYKCGIAYRSKVDINRHLFWKHGAEGVICRKCLQKKWPYIYHFCLPLPVYTCDECNINFSKPIALTVHKRLHSNEYPFGCDKCEEKFIAKKLLEKHTEKIHTVRLSPVEEEVFEEQMKKIEGEKLSEDVNPDEKTGEKENKKKKKKGKRKLVDVYDLPPLNLSSDSDDDDDDDDDSNPNNEESNKKESNENEEDSVGKNEEIKSSIDAGKSEFADLDPNKEESNQKDSNKNEENNVDKNDEGKSSIEPEKSELAYPDPKKEEPNQKDSDKNEEADKNKVKSSIEAEKFDPDSDPNKDESNKKDPDLENKDVNINEVQSIDSKKSEIFVPDLIKEELNPKDSENKIIAAEGDKMEDRKESSDTNLIEKKEELCNEESKLTTTNLEDNKEKSDPDNEKAEDQNGTLIVKTYELPEENEEVEKESLGTTNDGSQKEAPLEKVVDTPGTDLAKVDNDIWERLNILVDFVAEKEKTQEKESIPEPIVPNFDYIMSEHNYCIPDSIFKTTEKNISSSDGRYGDKKFNHRSRHNSECGTPCKQQKHRMKKDGRRGSSSSSSDSDTSASTCGSNCSCSHSSSSSSSSSESGEDSSPEKYGEKKKKKKCKQQKSTGESQLDESKSSSTPDENSMIINYSKTIQESDLETDISSAEEDFYSERPYEPPVIGDVPQTLIAEQEQSINKKSKSQKKKRRKYKDYLSKSLKKKKKTSQKSSPNSFNNNNRRPPSTSSYHQRVPPPPVVYGHLAAQNELLSPDGSHELESDGSRTKRKRTKNKFYGYSSSDEERTTGGPGGGLQGSLNKKINIKPDMPPRGSPNYINNNFPSPVDRPSIRPPMGPRVMYPSTSRMIGPGGYSGQQHLQRPEFGGYPPNLSGYSPNQQRLQRPSAPVYHRLSNPGRLAFNRSPSRAPHGSVHQPKRLPYRLPLAQQHQQQHQQRVSSPMGGGTGLRILPPVNKKSNAAAAAANAAAAAGGFSSSFSSSDSATNSPVKKVNPLYININTGVSSKPSVIHNNSLASTGMASGSSFYSNTSSIDPSSEMEVSKSEKNDNLYCYCRCPYDEVSEMIACDGPNCKIEWFHFECVGIMVPPKGKWFCPSCRKGKEYAKYFP